MAESSTVSVDFSVDDIDTHMAFHTKIARLLHWVLGDNGDITLVDNLRVTLKEKKQQKCKPSKHIIQPYTTLTAKLHFQVGLLKRETKTQVVEPTTLNTRAFQIDSKTKHMAT